MTTRCGTIALVGRPNAGKSTLLNALIGAKIAGVSAKPQTTRNKILGIITEGDIQFLFLDSPGLHGNSRKRFNTLMNREARRVAADADLVCYLVDVAAGWHDEDSSYLARIAASVKKPIVVLGTKRDKLKDAVVTQHLIAADERLHALRQELETSDHLASAIRPISAKRPAEVTELRHTLGIYLPEGPFLYEEDDMTDRSERFVCSEMIRESIFRLLGEELPYQTAVRVEALEHKEEMIVVRASIIVARAPQKAIVIGKNGSKIKEIGQHARETLEKHFGAKVFLETSVVVAENWIESDKLIAELTELDP